LQAVQSFLDRSDLADDGVGLGGLLTAVRVLSMVCAACAVAAAVQAWQVRKRSRHARLALTILAAPLFLSGLVADGLVGSAAATFWCAGVSAAALTLWIGPSRIWFGDPPPPARAPRPEPPRSVSPRGPDAPQPPPSSFPFGTPPPRGPTTRVTAPPPTPAPPPTSAYHPHPRAQSGRPRALLWACVLTWVCTGVAAAGLGLSLAMLSGDSDSMLDELYRRDPTLADQGLSQHAVLTMLYVISALVLAAAAAAAVFALLLFLGHHWAWYALVVSASAATLLFLVGSFGSPIAIVMLVASVATVACLVRPEVRGWLLLRRRPPR
jgi:hypothetical protein